MKDVNPDRSDLASILRAARLANLSLVLILCCVVNVAVAAGPGAINNTAAATPGQSGAATTPYPVIPVALPEADATDESEPAPSSRSGFLIAPYLWVPSIKGPVGAGTTRQDIDLSSSDLIRDAKSGLMGYLRWTFGRQFVYFEGVKAGFDDDSFESFFRQGVDSDISFLEAGYGLDFLVQSSALPQGQLWLSPYLGVRYASLEVKIGVVDPVRFLLENPDAALRALEQRVPMNVDDSIVDPVLGLFVDLPLSRRFSFLLKLDGAGFDLDQSSYWNSTGLLGYDFSDRWSILAGYRYARIKAQAGQDNDLNLDWRLSGPIGSLSYTF